MKSFRILGISTVRIINDAFLDHHILVAGYVTGYARAPGDIRKDERAFTEADNLGKRLQAMIVSINANRA